MPPKRRKVAGTANPELAQAMCELRRSSAAAPHVPSPRKGTRGVARTRAIRDSSA